MSRRQKNTKRTTTIVFKGKSINVILHPPTKRRMSWFAYWNGLSCSKSTGQANFEDAVKSVHGMVQSWVAGQSGRRATVADAFLTDEEFEEIQRVHFGLHQSSDGKMRAAKTLDDCLEAIGAFREIVRMDSINFTQPIAAATPDVCAEFQRVALALPRNWRKKYPKSKEDNAVGKIRANTVLKWSRALQAAFNRANRNAGKKCVRGVVPNEKLLTENPWTQFTWIKGEKRPIRQFDGDELLSVLAYFNNKWAGISAAVLLAKICLWSQCRRMEATSLKWDQLKVIGSEYHFEVVGKWGVEKWFRVPEALYQELLAIRTESPFVFAAYGRQLHRFYKRAGKPWKDKMISAEFNPANLGDWFHDRLVKWSATLPKGHATTHVFRKTSLQYALSGESMTSRVAADARVSESVMLEHYAKVTDPERRDQSNRMYNRIAASLGPEVAKAYGYVPAQVGSLEDKLKAAVDAKDWPLAARLTAELSKSTPAELSKSTPPVAG